MIKLEDFSDIYLPRVKAAPLLYTAKEQYDNYKQTHTLCHWLRVRYFRIRYRPNKVYSTYGTKK